MANPYHIQLLNELHHHFPEILYNHTRFQNVVQVLGYMNDVIRMNPQHQAYHYYHQQYHAQYQDMMDDPLLVPQIQRRSNAAEAMAESIDRLDHGNPYAAMRSMNAIGQPPSPTYPPPDPPLVRSVGASAEPNIRIRSFISLGNSSDLFSSLLSHLLQEPLANMDNLENVIVTPTPEQLRDNTTVTVLQENKDDNCAICQDPLNKDHEVRTITHCDHMFHIQCIDTWFQRDIHCPCCRHDIRDE